MKKTIACAALALVLCVSMITGATFALFTAKSETNIAVTSGTVKVVATVTKAETDWIYSPTLIAADGSSITDATNAADLTNGIFKNEGTASVEGATVKMNNATPGDKVNFVVNVANSSNVAIKYRTVVSAITGDYDLLAQMNIVIDGNVYNGNEVKSTWMNAKPNAEILPFDVSIELPISANDDVQTMEIAFEIKVEAVQSNADTTSESTAAVAGSLSDFAALLADTAANGAGQDVTIQLPQDFVVDTEAGESWTTLGDGIIFSNVKSLTIDGMGHKISGIDAPLLTGAVGGNLTIKNLTLDSANINKPAYNGLGVGAFLAYTDVAGDVTFNNCHVVNSYVECNADDSAAAGAFVGNFSSSYALTFNKCSVENTDVKAISSAAGFVGLSYGTKLTITNCAVKDVDVTATEDGASWRVGLLIGTMNRTGANVNISNTTVSGTNTLNMTNPGANNITDNRDGVVSKLYGRIYDSIVIDNVTHAATNG